MTKFLSSSSSPSRRTPFDQPSQLLNPIAGAMVTSAYLVQHLNLAGLTPPSALSFLHGLVTRHQHLGSGRSKYLVVLLIRTGRDEAERWHAVGAGLGEMGAEGEAAEPIAEQGADWFEALMRDLNVVKGRIEADEEKGRFKEFGGEGALLAAS
jgi:hypothetical protein